MSPLEQLKLREQSVRERHEEMLRAREKNPNDSELRVNVDKLYDEWSRVKREIAQLESGEK
ncbi:MAG: hypothetical protein AAB594_00560 [Patescibacteria group bacterium]